MSAIDPNPIRVVDWLPYDKVTDEHKDVGSMGGWFKEGMRWKDYLEQEPVQREYAEAIRAAVLERNLYISGDAHQNDSGGTVPLFSDGAVATFSFRGWGDLMAAIWSEAEGRDYSYMDFYMDCTMRGQAR